MEAGLGGEGQKLLRLHYVRTVSPRYSKPYPVLIGEGLVDSLGELLSRFAGLEPRQCLLVFPEPLYSLAGRSARGLESLCEKLVEAKLPDGEAAKSLETVLELISLMHKHNFSRRDLVVVVGGGAASDAAGFAAAVYKRGIPYVTVPTTLLSMVDAAIGGKTAVNYGGLKNMIGAFYQPRAVIEDVSVLATLPEIEWLSGLGEVVKYAYTLSEKLHRLLYRVSSLNEIRDGNTLLDVIYYSVDSKARIVEIDEREEYGVREILNFGHTVGHAIEEAARGRVKHGIAVAWGCVVEAWVGTKLGLTPENVAKELERVVEKLGMPKPPIPPMSALRELIRRDKKVHGDVIRGVFTLGPGRGVVVEVSLVDYLAAVERVLKELSKR